jgi:hypothetical protein
MDAMIKLAYEAGKTRALNETRKKLKDALRRKLNTDSVGWKETPASKKPAATGLAEPKP